MGFPVSQANGWSCGALLTLNFERVVVFTGTSRVQQIKVWDIRARAAVYELATGNNEVNSLAWDPKHNTLFAATECAYMDMAGYRHGYRPGTKFEMNLGQPSTRTKKKPKRGEVVEDDDDYEKCWPAPAWHFEDYYEYPFDSGDHRVCKLLWRLRDEMKALTLWYCVLVRYAFKQDPDTAILPEYGDARVGESFWN